MIQNMGWQMTEWQMKHNLFITQGSEEVNIRQTDIALMRRLRSAPLILGKTDKLERLASDSDK